MNASDKRLVRAREYVHTMVDAHTSVEPEVVYWTAALDNYEPTRAYANGYAVRYLHDGQTAALVLWPGVDLAEPSRCHYAVDDGASVTLMYVAGSGADYSGGRLHVMAFPTNPDGRVRDDNGQVIDYTRWMVGPRRTYHLKVRRPVVAS